jgi:hypothetical protein
MIESVLYREHASACSRHGQKGEVNLEEEDTERLYID